MEAEQDYVKSKRDVYERLKERERERAGCEMFSVPGVQGSRREATKR